MRAETSWQSGFAVAEGGAPALLGDVHGKLERVRVAEVVPASSEAVVRTALRRARERGLAVSIAGGRHAMGGQQLAEGALHLDMRPLARVIGLDRERGLLEVEAGSQWPELAAAYLEMQVGEAHPWGFRQKQTGADRLTLGGTLSANAHGRGLALPPFVADVESFTLLDAEGERRTCSRAEEPELFGLAIGGYGLFGVVTSLRLRLAPRRKLERVVELRPADGLVEAVAGRIAAGYLYGDFQFAIDPASPGYLRDGIFSCYRPADPEAPVPAGQRELADDDWRELVHLAHVDPGAAFDRYCRHYLATSGQLYWSDLHQMGFYADDYHGALDRRVSAPVAGSEMITELYVPREELAGFLAAAADWLRDSAAGVIYGTVRFIERDDETFLAWARQRYACVVLNLHVDHHPAGLAAARRQFRGLIDLARARGGTYFLTYHRWATREQLDACHPQLPAFLRRKLAHDPAERFQSEWYRHLRGLYADVL